MGSYYSKKLKKRERELEEEEAAYKASEAEGRRRYSVIYKALMISSRLFRSRKPIERDVKRLTALKREQSRFDTEVVDVNSNVKVRVNSDANYEPDELIEVKSKTAFMIPIHPTVAIDAAVKAALMNKSKTNVKRVHFGPVEYVEGEDEVKPSMLQVKQTQTSLARKNSPEFEICEEFDLNGIMKRGRGRREPGPRKARETSTVTKNDNNSNLLSNQASDRDFKSAVPLSPSDMTVDEYFKKLEMVVTPQKELNIIEIPDLSSGEPIAQIKGLASLPCEPIPLLQEKQETEVIVPPKYVRSLIQTLNHPEKEYDGLRNVAAIFPPDVKRFKDLNDRREGMEVSDSIYTDSDDPEEVKNVPRWNRRGRIVGVKHSTHSDCGGQKAEVRNRPRFDKRGRIMDESTRSCRTKLRLKNFPRLVISKKFHATNSYSRVKSKHKFKLTLPRSDITEKFEARDRLTKWREMYGIEPIN